MRAIEGQKGKTRNAKSLKTIESFHRLEARGGIEPPNKGFADLCLTTWLPRLRGYVSIIHKAEQNLQSLRILKLLRQNHEHP